MADWVVEHTPPSDNPSILEVGSGNGTLLFALAEAGFDIKSLTGIDYSSDAVKLARSIAHSRSLEAITFNVCDFLTDDPPPFAGSNAKTPFLWDVLLDKGTYDAIALGEKEADGRFPIDKYPSRVARLLKPGGFFLITCMWILQVSREHNVDCCSMS